MTAITLHRTNASGDLLPARFAQTFGALARIPGAAAAPRVGVRGQALHFATTLALEDDVTPSFVLEFAAQGARVSGTARGPSAALLAWGLHAVAASLKARLVEDEVERAPDPEAYRAAALAYLEGYEAEVRGARKRRDDDAASFVAWLAREEQLELTPDAALPELVLDDAPTLYEALLEADAIADVFLSERELAAWLARFKARGSLR